MKRLDKRVHNCRKTGCSGVFTACCKNRYLAQADCFDCAAGGGICRARERNWVGVCSIPLRRQAHRHHFRFCHSLCQAAPLIVRTWLCFCLDVLCDCLDCRVGHSGLLAMTVVGFGGGAAATAPCWPEFGRRGADFKDAVRVITGAWFGFWGGRYV